MPIKFKSPVCDGLATFCGSQSYVGHRCRNIPVAGLRAADGIDIAQASAYDSRLRKKDADAGI